MYLFEKRSISEEAIKRRESHRRRAEDAEKSKKAIAIETSRKLPKFRRRRRPIYTSALPNLLVIIIFPFFSPRSLRLCGESFFQGPGLSGVTW
jgi:hypothetical protein